MTGTGVCAVRCGALFDKLRINTGLASSTEAGLVPAGGWELLLVAVLLQMRLLMGAWFKQALAGSGHIRSFPQGRVRKEWAFVFSVELVL